MVERPETVKARVREWLLEAIGTLPPAFQDIDEGAVLDNVDETLSSDENIAILAEQFGLPTPEELEVEAGTRRGREVEAIQEEQRKEQEAASVERQLEQQIEEAGPGERGAAVRQLVEFRLRQELARLRTEGVGAERLEGLERRIREAEKRVERRGRAVIERLAELRPGAAVGPPTRIRATAKELLRPLDDRERAFRDRLDNAVARLFMRQNEANDFRRRIRNARRELEDRYERDEITADLLVEGFTNLVEQLDADLTSVLEGRAEVVAPTVQIDKPPRRAPAAPGAPPLPGEGIPEVGVAALPPRVREFVRPTGPGGLPVALSGREAIENAAAALVLELNRIRKENPEFVARRLADGASAQEIISEFRRMGGFMPTR
jgi:hypothetical protein